MTRVLFVFLSVLSLSACASYWDTPNQRVQFLTPGATGAKCVITTGDSKVVVYTPGNAFLRRSQKPLKVNCLAPGNREKTIIVPASVNKTAATDVATAGVGAVYDQISGALYTYPEVVTVDFTNTRARVSDMPLYHAPDTVSPFDHVNEDMRDNPAQHPEEQGAPKKATIQEKALISKEKAAQAKKQVEIERPY